MLLLKRILSVVGILSLMACSSVPSIQPMDRVIPPACQQQCLPLPKPENPSDLALRQWMFQTLSNAGECRLLHQECIEWVNKDFSTKE